MDVAHSNLVDAFLLFAVIFVLTIAGVLVVKRFRGHMGKEAPVTNDMITTFRQLRAVGDLSEEEYRTIRTKLESDYRKESRDDGR